ncbi:MAG: hypothetical protein KGI38_12420 [Thaumarchaeota archaeon]|nr:hypothetical protein [Nitrososphaerota archaeon]
MGATLGIKEDTKADFDKLKGTVAATMSADEFLRVLMTVYRSQRIRMEEAAR